MATENPGRVVSREAGANIVNKRFVNEVAGGKVDRCAIEGEQVDGVVAMISYGKTGSTIAAGDECPVCKDGDCIVESGALVLDNAIVMTDTVGRAITWDGTSFVAGRVVNGSSAGAAGEDLTIELAQPGQYTTPDLT